MASVIHKILNWFLTILFSLFWTSYLFAAELDYTSPLVFNADEYLQLNPDVATLNIDAKEHWIKIGMKECRQASSQFSSTQYLLANPKVAAYFGKDNCHAAVWDYLTYGHSMGRKTAPTQDSILVYESSAPSEEYLKNLLSI